MLEKSIVRFFKSTGTGYVPLDWTMFNHGFYKQQKDFQVPIAKWVDGLAVKPFQLLYKEGKIYQVAKVNTVGTWAGLDVVEIKGLMGIVRDFKPATYILQDVVIYNDALYVCKTEGFHVAWNPDNWVLATDKVLSGSKAPRDEKINFYGVKSRQPLSVWKENGWLTKESPYGWFQWYIHFYLGRRDIIHQGKLEDAWQIGRWRSFVARHMGQVAKGCTLSNVECRPVQRQGLLQWGWDSKTQLFDEKLIANNAKKHAKATGAEIVSLKEFVEHYTQEPAKESLHTFDW